eukprot:scaffold265712_cov50-Attheya_sp.AAC.1
MDAHGRGRSDVTDAAGCSGPVIKGGGIMRGIVAAVSGRVARNSESFWIMDTHNSESFWIMHAHGRSDVTDAADCAVMVITGGGIIGEPSNERGIVVAVGKLLATVAGNGRWASRSQQ